MLAHLDDARAIWSSDETLHHELARVGKPDAKFAMLHECSQHQLVIRTAGILLGPDDAADVPKYALDSVGPGPSNEPPPSLVRLRIADALVADGWSQANSVELEREHAVLRTTSEVEWAEVLARVSEKIREAFRPLIAQHRKTGHPDAVYILNAIQRSEQTERVRASLAKVLELPTRTKKDLCQRWTALIKWGQRQFGAAFDRVINLHDEVDAHALYGTPESTLSSPLLWATETKSATAALHRLASVARFMPPNLTPLHALSRDLDHILNGEAVDIRPNAEKVRLIVAEIERQTERQHSDADEPDGGAASVSSARAAGDPASPGSHASFRRTGAQHWHVSFGGQSATIADSLGMDYLCQLLACPGLSVHVWKLRHGVEPPPESVECVIDDAAMAAMRKAIETKLAEHAETTDLDRRTSLDHEVAILRSHLKAATTNVGGKRRPRRARTDAEKMRELVGKAISTALHAIEASLPRLHEHLCKSLKVPGGMNPMYAPDELTPWTLMREHSPDEQSQESTED
jgi:hypothetical protein